MHYDPSADALFHPEKRAPLFGELGGWTLDARCAELSRLAYVRLEESESAKQALNAALVADGFGAVTPFLGGAIGAEGFGVVREGIAYVVFRGTQPDKAKDYACDANFIPVGWPGGGRVHSGFASALASLDDAVDRWLDGTHAQQVVVTGHSLGAAIATLLAARVAAADLVTFGSPRVGTRAFGALFEGRNVRRYVDCCDLVADLPPAVGYKHLTGERYIDRLARIADQPPGRLDRAGDQIAASAEYLVRCARPGNAPLRNLADHAPINYVSALLGVRTGP